jgi:hypothetical protein
MSATEPSRRAHSRSRKFSGALRCVRPSSAELHVPDGALSVREQIDIVLRDDAVFASAAVIPPKGKGTRGRSRDYPEFTWLLWPELRAIFGSHRSVERELGRSGWWSYIRAELRRLRPDLPELPSVPPRRQHYEYWRDMYLATDEGIERAQAIHIEHATSQAKKAGNLDPNGAGSPTHPEITRALYGDGKTIKALYDPPKERKNKGEKKSDESPVRVDEDAAWYEEGGDAGKKRKKEYGIKLAYIHTRRPEGRFILGVGHAGGNEPKVAVDLLRLATQHAPGAQAVVWDMALRGSHIQTILTELGLVPVVKVHAESNPDGGRGRRAGSYIPKTADLDHQRIIMPDGKEQLIMISADDGWVSVKELDEVGAPHYRHLELIRLQRHQNKDCTFRWYGYYKLPAEYGGKVISVRLHKNAEDAGRWLNRTEVLRPIPEGSDDFSRLHVLRADAESINRGIEDTLFINRASAKGWRRLLVDQLGYARLVNAITLARCRSKKQTADAA